MNVYTGMAIDAFRAQEAARRRLGRAEQETWRAMLMVPRDEIDLYFLHTELIRFEMDKRDSESHHDHRSVEAAERLIVQTREKIRELEAAKAATVVE